MDTTSSPWMNLAQIIADANDPGTAAYGEATRFFEVAFALSTAEIGTKLTHL
jgi:hypothetical protein